MNKKALRVLEYYKIIEMLKEKASSSLGKKLVQELEPSNIFEEVESWQKETSEAQSLIFKSGNIPLGGIHDVYHLARRAGLGSALDPGQLLLICDTLRAARRMKTFIEKREDSGEYPALTALAQSLTAFRDVEEDIENSIINENEISDSASHQLRSIRRRIVQKNDDIRSKLHAIITSPSYQKYLQDAIVTIRGDRFVVPVKHEYKSNVPGIVHDQSSSGATLFIEPMSIVNMNNDLRELRISEREEIERILKELSGRVGEIETEIRINLEMLSKIDFIFAKGKLSVGMRALEPALSKDMKLKIKKARHPLIPPGQVVPINIWLGDEFTTLVITGPNTGGKTVTLKTVGLFSLMVQSGLHIPADYGTSMCVFENIFADIGDEQSIEQSLSTFSSHMTNIVEIMRDVTADSLVLFDELGAGTDPVEGAALAMSILDDLYKMKVRTVATTHYSELKQYALTKPGIENASVEFDVATLSPTYRLLIGVPGKSNAFEISHKLGLESYIIDNAKKLISAESLEFEDLLQDIESKRHSAQEDSRKAIIERQQAERLRDELNQKIGKMELERDRVISQAKREAQALLKKAKAEADEIVKKLRELEKAGYSSEMSKQVQKIRQDMKKSMGSLDESVEGIIIPKVPTKQVKSLREGEEVEVVTLGQTGSVISSDDRKKEAVVQIGIMKMNLPYASLKRIEKDKAAKASSGAGKIMKSKSQSIGTEVDLRGMNLEEAMYEVDKYLDDAYIAHLEKVVIIHGIGTGVLKAGIKQMLKKHAHVKSFRDGEYGEGGAGVTVVHLK